jgi:alpha-1,2-mannosyltransferase
MADRSPPTPAAGLFEGGIGLYACVLLLVAEAALLARWAAEGYSLFGAQRASFDFEIFWGAGRLALAGKAAAAYDWSQISRVLSALLEPPSGLPSFFYPPVFLLVLTPLAAFPYAAAAAIWLAATLLCYLAAVYRILPRGRALLAAAAAPATLFNIAIGQTGLLTAALLGGALALLDERPRTAGVLIGLLVYKPQFGLLFPLLLAITGRWRVFATAAATVLVLLTASVMLFGWQVFAAFAVALTTYGDIYFGRFWIYLVSPYGMLRSLGATPGIAWSVHIAVAVIAAGTSLRLAAGRAPAALKAAAIATAAFVVTPYSESCDVAILTIAIAFVLADGASRLALSERLALFAVFVLPLVFIDLKGVAEHAGLGATLSVASLGPLMAAITAWVIARRVAAARDRPLWVEPDRRLPVAGAPE